MPDYDKSTDTKCVKTFITFCIQLKIWDKLLIELQRKHVDKRRLIRCLSSTDMLYNTFNGLLDWNNTLDGWMFWANISYLWKCYLSHLRLLPQNMSMPFQSLCWEIRGGLFKKISRFQYYYDRLA